MEDDMRDPSPPPGDNWDYGYHSDYMENGPGELQQRPYAISDPMAYRDKGKGKQPAKRPALEGEMSADSSDLEMPVAVRRDKSGHAIKKRKIDKDAADMADELERSITGDLPSPSKPGPSVKSKGGQIPPREGTPESISATVKAPKKRAAPRKKLDNLPPETLELLGLGSAPPSVSGDVTPSVSRPASPALTATSNIVYELDEVVPALKRAKKVDDVAMLKRIKALEEAQRKVWTNIARRDVAKVRAGFVKCSKTY